MSTFVARLLVEGHNLEEPSKVLAGPQPASQSRHSHRRGDVRPCAGTAPEPCTAAALRSRSTFPALCRGHPQGVKQALWLHGAVGADASLAP